MNRLTIGGGLYSPLEVEIDGQVFKVRKISRAAIKKLDALQADYDTTFKGVGDKDIRKAYATLQKVYAELMVIFGPEALETIEALDFIEASKLMQSTLGRTMNPEVAGEVADPEKNAPKPGDVTEP